MARRRNPGAEGKWIGLMVCILLAACGGGGGDKACSTEEQNRFVHQNMLERYYWYERLPLVIEYDRFDSPQDTVEYLRYETLDRFSYVTSRVAFNNLFDNGTYLGYGFSFVLDGDNRVWIRFVYQDSPAGRGGVERGDEILQIDGRGVADIVAGASLTAALGPAQIGHPITLRIRRGNGNIEDIDLAKDTVVVNTVLYSEVYSSGADKIGYLVFSSFLRTSPAELDPIFAQFRTDGVNQLILDLRYNGGGSISVSRDLASYIKATADEDTDLYLELRYNDKLQDENFRFYYRKQPNSLGLDEVTIITSATTCSASEQLISGLRPFFSRVTTIGATSCGKPVGFNPADFCDSSLLAVNFAGYNADGRGDFFSGIPPDCNAVDNVGFAFGDPDEPMLQAARHYNEFSTCLVAPRAPAAPVENLRGLQAIAGAV